MRYPPRVDEALAMIVENAETIGAFRTMSDDRYVSLAPLVPQAAAPANAALGSVPSPSVTVTAAAAPEAAMAGQDERPLTRSSVGHSRGTKVLGQVKQLLELADLRAEVAVEQETAAIPVPDKVFDAMRRSDAAIICVTADTGQEGDDGYHVTPTS